MKQIKITRIKHALFLNKLSSKLLKTSPKVYALIELIKKINFDQKSKDFLLHLFRNPKVLERVERMDVDSLIKELNPHPSIQEISGTGSPANLRRFRLLAENLLGIRLEFSSIIYSDDSVQLSIEIIQHYIDEWNLLDSSAQEVVANDFFSNARSSLTRDRAKALLRSFMHALKKHKQTWISWNDTPIHQTSILNLNTYLLPERADLCLDVVFTRLPQIFEKYPEMEETLGPVIRIIIENADYLVYDSGEDVFEDILVGALNSVKRNSRIFKRLQDSEKENFAWIFVELWNTGREDKAMEFLDIISLIDENGITNYSALFANGLEGSVGNFSVVTESCESAFTRFDIGSLENMQRIIAYFASLDPEQFLRSSKGIFKYISEIQFSTLCAKLAKENSTLVQLIGERLEKEVWRKTA